jgi:hypothetical protein
MNYCELLSKGFSLERQRAGQAPAGPIGPALGAMSAFRPFSSNDLPAGVRDLPLSRIGFDLARNISKQVLWVLFVNTGGSGIAPWRRMIILDTEYRGEGQVGNPSRIGMVAHELAHLLQREINQPHYWPSGGFNPVRGRRWIGDSTSYMEMLAYLVGWTVEYDLLSAGLLAGKGLEADSRLATIRRQLAIFTGVDAPKIGRLIRDQFPNNTIYRQNTMTESRYLDRRVPPGSWHNWLRQLGFSRLAVDRIMVLAAQGNNEGKTPM